MQNRPLQTLGLVFVLCCSFAFADWPTYQYDASRSGSTTESAPKDPKHAWTYKSPTPPVPAWDEPALWDGYSKVYDLKNRQVFDKVFHVVEAKGRVYFGSSVDEQVHCLDTKTGDTVWTYYTEGPVRLAPTLHNDRLYVGSDDGFVYCLNAENGELIWKKSPGPQTRRVSGNGRVVSPWAIRTGIVIESDTVYCGAGVIPSEGVFVVAMDAETGEQKWKSEMKDLPAQGYMLASKKRLYVVTGRDTPIVLDVKDGKRLHKVKGGTGGTYALLTGDTLLYGPSKTGDVAMVGEKQDVLASFQGNHMIVAQPLSYLQSKNELSSLDRGEYVKVYGERNQAGKLKSAAERNLKKAKEELKKEEKNEELKTKVATLTKEVEAATKEFKQLGDDLKACLKWRTKCQVPFSLILADGVLIGGGDGEVIAIDAKTGDELWQRDVPGKAYGLAVSDGTLFVSTDSGTIHCFADDVEDKQISTTSFVPRKVRHQSFQGIIEGAERIPAEIHGPFTEFVAPGKIKIEWDSLVPTTSQLRFGVDMETARDFADDEVKTRHEFVVDEVQPEVVYRFQVGGKPEEGDEIMTEAYRFDSHLVYLPTFVPEFAPAFDGESPLTEYATELIETAGNRGYAIVVGATDGRLAYEIARQSDLNVIVIEQDAKTAKAIRTRLSKTPFYGSRISVHSQDLATMKYGPFLANVLTSESYYETGELPSPIETLYQCVRPAGGLLSLKAKDGGQVETANSDKWKEFKGGKSLVHVRSRLPKTGEWSHQYASADNSACSKDDAITGALAIQWWGRPGARPMPDRGNRNPPPVSANGRLYVQGNRTLFGLDAYNGTVLWAKQIPTMRRANMPRDGSNMVAADEHVCVAIGGKCVAFDGSTGKRLRDFEVPEQLLEERPGQSYDWGFVSRIESQVFGSAVKRGAAYLGDKGEWYEGFGDKDIAKVTSDGFFAKNAYSGETNWTYSNGQIINSTITIADGKVFFIESRNEAARDAESGRLTREILKEQVLVAMDAVSGDVLWEKPYDFSVCKYVAYMTHGNGTLLVTGTDQKSVFHTFAFNSVDGAELWKHQAAEKKGHHTGQLAHPTIVGDLVYFNKHTYKLRTGEVLGVHNFNWHGCGVMSASNHTVFSRYEYHGMLDLKTNQRTEFLGVRSGCWLSLIPSGGLLLAPETSAGCSCGHSIQTSLAYVPTALLEAAEESE